MRNINKYLFDFKDLFENCIKQERERKISFYQGNGYSQSFGGLVDFFRKENNKIKNYYLEKLSKHINNPDFHEQMVSLKKDNIKREIVRLKAKIKKEPNNIINFKLVTNEKLLNCLNWDSLRTDFYEVYSKEIPNIVYDWKICLLDDLFNEYKRCKDTKFEYDPKNPLKDFYQRKGINLEMDNNYGLFSVSTGFQIKANGLPKIYDKNNDTHIFIRFVPNDFVRYLAELKTKCPFDIAFRPDYNLIGEHIKDLSLILDGVIKGNTFDTRISQLPKLSQLSDYSQQENSLIIQKKGNDLTFEELVEDFEVYDDFIVTQVIHLQYECNKETEYITHIDHEYVFYNVDEYEKKKDILTLKGNARKRFKTFKIDKARIEFTFDANSNIVFQALKAFFKNDDLINEYFENIIK